MEIIKKYFSSGNVPDVVYEVKKLYRRQQRFSILFTLKQDAIDHYKVLINRNNKSYTYQVIKHERNIYSESISSFIIKEKRSS